PPSDDGSAAGKDLFICSHSLGATASLCAATVTQCEDLNLAPDNVFGNFSNNFCLLNVDSAGGGLIPLDNIAESDDFGSVDIDSGTNTHSYKLSNPNNYAVTVLLAVTDEQMQTTNDFKVSSPTLMVPAHGTAEFSVEFNPTAVGAHTGLVQAKLSGRADKFYVQGTGKLDSPPVANPTKQVIKVLEDAANTELSLSPFFSDPDGDVISLSLGNNTNSNLVTPSLNGGILTLAYAPNQNGFASVQVFAQSKNKSVILPVEITVEPVDDAPTVNQPINTTTVDEDAPNTAIDLSTIFKDIEEDAISFSLVNNNNPGLVQASLNNANKTLNLTYLPNQHGSVAITIRATANGKTVDASFPVLVNPVDDLPTVSQPIAAVTVDEDAPNTVLDLSSTFSDVDGDTIDLQVVANTNSSLVKPTLTGKSLSLAYSPKQNGLATITVRATANGKTVDTT
ncbi:MAG TPA: Ig-like domain-containing protein, partial [Thiolinea sp.]|nr:Ig-like domain-containing protein [Thiolinea sp.]